jgi:hypothetical protein
MAFNDSRERYPEYMKNRNSVIHRLKASRFQLGDKLNL